MKVLLDARTDIPRFPGVGRYASELSCALAGLFASTGDQLALICNSAVRRNFPPGTGIELFDCDVAPDASGSCGALGRIVQAIKPDLYHTPNRICEPLRDLPTVGERLVGALIAATGLGVSQLSFIPSPLTVYVLYPLLLLAAGTIGAIVLTGRLRTADRSQWLR